MEKTTAEIIKTMDQSIRSLANKEEGDTIIGGCANTSSICMTQYLGIIDMPKGAME